jgi:uncharacterized membrane protein YqjE
MFFSDNILFLLPMLDLILHYLGLLLMEILWLIFWFLHDFNKLLVHMTCCINLLSLW